MINIICPAYTATGGTEALHQLCAELVRQGKTARMVYVAQDKKEPVPKQYTNYMKGIEWIWLEDFVGNEDEVAVFPEIYLDMIPHFKCKNYVWWLSVDNIRAKTDEWTKYNVTHLAQSWYSAEFLLSKGIITYRRLTDYINDIYTEDVDIEREDLVAFNPKKGFDNIAQLIYKMGGVKWVSINNMTPREIRDTLHRAKVYIDLGHNPGKDRMPREAVACGCNIITSRFGGFANDFDTPISDEYKVHYLGDAEDKIRELIECYSEMNPKFAVDRQRVLMEKDMFQKQVAEIFN